MLLQFLMCSSFYTVAKLYESSYARRTRPANCPTKLSVHDMTAHVNTAAVIPISTVATALELHDGGRGV